MLSELYVPGDSFLHRMPPQYMLLALAAFCTLLFLFSDWGVLAAAGLLVLVVYRVAGLRLHHAVTSVRPAFWVLAFIFAAHVLTTDISQAAIVVVRFVLMILAASVVTLTTRTSEFVGGIPFKRPQEPEDIGEAVAFYASDRARNITAAAENVSGGQMIW